MSVDDPVIDISRVDSYLRSRHRVEVLNSPWKPALAGAAGAVAIIGAIVAGVWIAGPRFSYREIEIPKITVRDAPFVNHVPQDKPFDNYVPHEVGAAPALAPRTSEERTFEGSREWSSADIRGRILRPAGKGFVLLTAAGEQSFFPSRLGADGKPETDEGMRDDVRGLLGDLAICRPTPNGLFQCVALKAGREVVIPEFSVKRGQPA